MTKFKQIILISVILIVATFVRFVSLDKIPAGLYVDEAWQGYNAYSVLKTGKDEYGKFLPLLFKSSATFQSPLYTYFTILPVFLLGLNTFSVRVVSAFSGLLLILFTYIFMKEVKDTKSNYLPLLTALMLALSPWSIFQSRVAVESNLALSIFILSLYLFLISLRKITLFIPACVALAISTYAYRGEQVLSFFIILFMLVSFYPYFKNNLRTVFVGIIIFFIILIPQVVLLNTAGNLQRFSTQGYMGKSTFDNSGGDFKKIPIVGRYAYITWKFTAQYISSYSPRNLFAEPESQIFRSMPTLSTFYFWMIIPFFLGIKEIWKRRKEPVIKFIIATIVFGPVPAALTADPFYTLRMLPMLWGITILISFGVLKILNSISNIKIRLGLGIVLLTMSVFSFYINYFVIFKNERSYAFGYPYLKFAEFSEQQKDKKFLLDTEIYGTPYILMATYKKTDPLMFQEQSDPKLLPTYYTDTRFNKYRIIDNVDVRPLDWSRDPCIDQIIVGDIVTISEVQALEHKFTLTGKFRDLSQQTTLWAYQTNPEEACGGSL